MKTVHLARGLTLPAAELATEVVASLGMRGSGKSNGAGVIAEGLLATGIQVIVLDHVGIWFSLRLDDSGKHPSPYKIPVLGGQHGDIALIATTGAVVAEALARSGSSAVLDVSSFSKGDRCRFAADFAEAFFQTKKLHPGPVQILLEEAQRYVPQKLFAGQGLERMLGAFEEIAEVGRNYGVGLHLVSQRPQKINKDVLNLADTVLAYRSNGVLERKAISDWVQEKGAEGRKEMHNELPGLARGTAIVWSPNRSIYSRFAIEKKSTYDAGATPTHARAAVKTKRLDLDQLEAAMGAAVEQSKANDPRALKARVAELERELAKKSTAAPTIVAAKEHVVEVPLLGKRDLKRIDRLREQLREMTAALDRSQQSNNRAQADANTLILKLDELSKTDPRSLNGKPAIRGNLADRRHEARLSQESRRSLDRGIADARAGRVSPVPPEVFKGVPVTGIKYESPDSEHMPAKCQKMLGALRQGEAMGKASMLFRSVAAIAGVAPNSGTTSNRKGFLKNNGYITVEGDHVRLTEKGRAYPLNVTMPPTDRNELLDYWKREIGTEKIAKILETVVHLGPIDDERLREHVGMENSGTYSNYKGALVSRGLIEKRGKEYVATEAFQ